MVAHGRADGQSLIQVQVDGLNDDGLGVARVDGKVVFIDNALPGETVRYRPQRRRRRYDTGQAVEWIERSPERVTPRCEYFGVCGGCAMQHLAAEAQIEYKQQHLLDSLHRIGGVEPDRELPPLVGPVWGYRRKARLGIRYVPKKGGVLLGFREKRKSYITSLDHCDVLDPTIAQLLVPLRQLIAALSCYDRLPQVEIAVGDDDRALVFRHLLLLTDADRAHLEAFAHKHNVQVYVQSGNLESVRPLWPTNPNLLTYALDEFHVTNRFAPTDFIQVNADLNRDLVRVAVDWLAPTRDEQVLDLFCGIGNFTLPLARRAGRVTGVEGAAALIDRARDNARHNGLANVNFEVADLGEPGLTAMWLKVHYAKILLDPPRSGAIEVLKRIPALCPERIVYVSCNPQTLARDAELLVRKSGFRLLAAGVIDMFPHTAHVESMAVFEPR
ncbi:MAG: 23S rRNA (uracil(1939)-C(5))-methyltransferase RlmD [Gammaproteobacteria bacterium]|nr:23S rRNA (uracil(1939)-C(5))-methyltransferase RlmD [Gammaproteobacteria bacterium]